MPLKKYSHGEILKEDETVEKVPEVEEDESDQSGEAPSDR